jgi:ribosomal protein L7/L12
MAKFEKGQWLRVTNNDGAPSQYKVGEIGKVEITYSDDMVRLEGKTAGMFDHRFEAWQPKVGDRVRVTYGHGWDGDGVVNSTGLGIFIVTLQTGDRAGEEGGFFLSDLQPATLTIEAGKFYKTRDGRKVGPAFVNGSTTTFGEAGNLASAVWTDTGRQSLRGDLTTELPNDIVAEWPVATAAPVGVQVDTINEEYGPVVPAVPAASNDNGPLSSLIGKSFTATVTLPTAKPKFKVGDVVRPLRSTSSDTATVTKVISDDDISVSWNNGAIGSKNGWQHWELALVSSTTPTAIVALIEDGVPKPAERPFVHASEAAAAKEAARLASKHKGQQFGVYVLTTTAREEKPEPTYGHRWQTLAAKGEKIAAIKELRTITGVGLKQAKDVVEHFVERPYGQIAA